jgi:AhpD family alkylhydroperoxidase
MTEHTHGKEVLRPLAMEGRALRQMIPDVYAGFAELLALVMGITLRCDGCIATHARGAASAGATREEVAEAIGVTLLMNGGPGTVYGPRAYDAFLEYIEAIEAKDAPTAG